MYKYQYNFWNKFYKKYKKLEILKKFIIFAIVSKIISYFKKQKNKKI